MCIRDRFNRSDLLSEAHGMGAQIAYFAEHWPQRKGVTTYFVTGDDHEGWYAQRENVEIGQLLEDEARRNGRTDLVYCGHMEHDFLFKRKGGSATMRLVHAGGGSAYATSYTVQKLVESYQGGEKPNILLVGHYHKADFSYPREVFTVQAGCTEDQSPFMRKKKIQAHVGGWTIEMIQSDDGLIHRFRPTWDPFYDLDFYKGKQWRYHWGKKR